MLATVAGLTGQIASFTHCSILLGDHSTGTISCAGHTYWLSTIQETCQINHLQEFKCSQNGLKPVTGLCECGTNLDNYGTRHTPEGSFFRIGVG